MSGYRDPMGLRAWSTAQLVEELARRANGRTVKKPEIWCEDCTHFVTWIDGPTPDRPMPETYNPCTKQHVMRFMAPEDFDEPYGHYLPVCADRDLKPNEGKTDEETDPGGRDRAGTGRLQGEPGHDRQLVPNGPWRPLKGV